MKTSKHLIYTLLLILSTTTLFAQPDWQWGQEVRVNAQHIATDNLGNAYVTWSLENNYTIDGENFVSNGLYDAALTSFDCDGAHRWTKIIGGSGGDAVYGLGTDTLGGVYLYCHVNGAREENYSFSIDEDETIISDRKSMLLVKYNTEGDFQWQQMPEDTVVFDISNLNFAFGTHMDVAPNGDCYIYSKLPIGTYGDEAFEATYTSTTSDSEDVYALIINSSGNCIGGVHFDLFYTQGSLVKFTQVRNHNTGNFYMSDNIDEDDTVIFGGEQVTAENYLVQFDPDGNVNWRVSMDDVDGYASEFVGKPTVDEFGNIYVTGNSYNGNSFGGFEFYNTIDNYNFPIFAKIDPTGNVLYATNASVPGTSKGKATAYSNSQVGVTGYYDEEIYWGDFAIQDPNNDQLTNVFLAFFEPSGNGLPNSMNVLNGSTNGIEYSSILTADRQGNFYVGGNFSGTLDIGDGTIYNQTGPQEGFIAKFGTDSCYCPLPVAAFSYNTIPNEEGFDFVYTGTTDVDSVVWDFGDGNTGLGMNPQHTYTQSGTYTVCATAYNDCGPDSICVTFEYDSSVGIKAIEGFEEIRVYPNPARDAIFIDHDLTNAQLRIVSAVGQQVLSTPLNTGLAQIDISSLPPGVYLLQFTDKDGKVGYSRIVKR